MRQTLKSIMPQKIVVCNNKLRKVETKGTDKEKEGGAREGKEKGERVKEREGATILIYSDNVNCRVVKIGRFLEFSQNSTASLRLKKST